VIRLMVRWEASGFCSVTFPSSGLWREFSFNPIITSMNPQFRFVCKTVDDTKALAAVIGRAVKGGEVIEFHSDLGGGKTTFVKGLAQGMGVTDVVQSPTFVISQLHKGDRGLELHHFDFYRLTEAGVMSAELAESLAQPNAVVAVEWGEIVADVLPKEVMSVTLATPQAEDRVISLVCPSKYDHIRQTLQNYQHNRKIA
jgi:tRNA threonylcarbamoyladenosine biosynthesis protein TsaE